MTAQTVNANRVWVSGAEFNDFGRNAPSDGNITTGTTHVRTGTYAYRVNAQSGVNSNWVQSNNDTKTNMFVGFWRGYLYIATMPTATRAIVTGNTTTPSGTAPGLRLRTTGVLELYDGTNVLAAGSTVLTTGTWYRIEIGANATDNVVMLKINGAQEIGWTAWTSGIASVTSWYIGALDTVAGTFDVWWDDLAIDRMDWCGPGKVARLAVTGAGTLTEAGFTIGGSAPAATKWQSLSEVTADDGVTYVITDVTSGHVETYTLDDVPGDCVQVRGLQYRMRFKRDGATNGAINVRSRLFGHNNDQTNIGSTSAWQTYESTDTAINDVMTPIGGQFTNERVNALEMGIKTNSTNATDYSQLGVELDYDDTVGALVAIQRIFATGWEAGDATAEGTVTGTAAVATNVARTGTYSLRVNPAGSTASHVRTTLSAASQREGYLSCYIYVTARPTLTSKMRLFAFTSTTSLNGAVLMDSAGKIQVEDRSGAVGSLSAAAIPLTTWTRLDFRIRCSTSTAGNDGVLDVRVGGVSVSSSTTANSNNSSWTDVQWGTGLAPGAGGCDVNYDDCLVDGTSWIDPGDTIKVVDLLPTAAGALTGTGYAAVGVANQWDAMDETPANDDTDYVTTGTTSPTTGTYVTSDTPANAGAIRSVTVRSRVVRDGATNGGYNLGLRTNGHSVEATAFASTSAYLWNRNFLQASTFDGAWTKALIDGSELAIVNKNANTTRVSNLRATVEYVVQTDVTISLPLSTMTLQAYAEGVPSPSIALPTATMTMQAYAPTIRTDYVVALPLATMTLQAFDMTTSFILIPFNWYTAGMFIHHPYHVLPIACPPYDTEEFDGHAYSTRMFTKDDL